MSNILDRDLLNAFYHHTHVEATGTPGGVLSGLNCGIKDVFDIAGQRTGFGSPDWLATHPPATRTATAVQLLLDAGANVVGKTHTDELTFSLAGENAHYGTPVNPNAPGRIPGGSSSGSAAATAGALVDFALGSDTGGSVRGPAALCGVYGMRPTHGRIPLDGARPLAPSMDTAGWFARDATLLETVGRVLLQGTAAGVPRALPRLLLARDAFDLLAPAVSAALAPAVAAVTARFAEACDVQMLERGFDHLVQVFRPLQCIEIWAGLGPWIMATQPTLGPGVRERFAWSATLREEDMPPLRVQRTAITAHLEALLREDSVLLLPTLADIAPVRGSTGSAMEEFRQSALRLLSAGGLSGLPQVSLPLAQRDGCPLGLSLMAPRHADEALLALARQLATPA